MNLGLGLGGVVGGLIATTGHPDSFTVLFLLDAATFVVFVGVLATVREPRVAADAREDRGGRYGAVLRDRNFLALLGLNVLFVAVGYEVFALLPPFAKNYADVSERWVGFIAATLVFGVGETLQGPTQAPLVADLAPDRLRGRYFALGSMSWSAGSILGPAVGGPLLGWHPLLVWPIAAAISGLAAVGCLALERRLPAGVRRTPRHEATPEPEQLTKPAPSYT